MPNESLDRYKRGPLHYAANEGDKDKVALLLKAGANVNLKDRNGWTPLHFAAQAQAAEVARMLLDSGAEVDAKDSDGNTPLSNAVFCYRGDGGVILLLRERGANPSEPNNYGVSPVQLARQIANYDVSKFFSDLP